MSYSKNGKTGSFSSYVDNLVGNAVVKKNTKALNNKLSKLTKKQRKSINKKEIIKFQKKVIKEYLALLKKKEFTTKFERETLKIINFELKKRHNELLLGESFKSIYYRINRLEFIYRGDLMNDYLEQCRNVFRMACCVLEKRNLKSLISLTTPREKADYNLLDISDLCNLALYSLTEPKEMLRLLDELPEIRCDLLADNYEKIVKKIDEILA